MTARPLRRVAVAVAGALLAAGCGGGSGGGDGLTAIGAGLRGPAGLQATIYATGLANVSGFALDPQGRLWVATAAADAEEGGDGVYLVASPGATPQKVISDVRTPLGLLWYDDSLYVSSAAGVDVEAGFDGSQFTSTRTIVTFATGTGENNGLALLPDGRISLGISAPCDHCEPTQQYSASVVTFAPDGTDLQVEASGIRAPVGLAVLPATGDLYVTMNQRDDLAEATPGDWLAVVRSGQDWGFPTCYGQADPACANVPPPTAVLDPHAAVSGIALVTGSLGTVVGSAALVAEWNTGKVLQVTLTGTDSTGVGSAGPAAVEPFLTGLQRPEPLLTTPAGTVLVGDWATGTVYEIAAAG